MHDATGHPCDGCDTQVTDAHARASVVCAAQRAEAGQPSATTCAPREMSARQPVLLLPVVRSDVRPRGLDGPPSGAPPRRILLHSFLI